jgi:hypothetical protein
MSDLLLDGNVKEVKEIRGRDTTAYTVVADDAEEAEIVGALARVVRVQNPSWTIAVLDEEGPPVT